MTREGDHGESEDYIYRGNGGATGPSPQDGQPWNPPPGPPNAAPPPAGPPPIAPQPTSPPPGFPPQQPAAMGVPNTPKKKRWPWVVAGLILFCGLPLGGCVGLVAFGANELSERNAEVGSTADLFLEAIEMNELTVAQALGDGEAPCTPRAQLVEPFDGLDPGWRWSRESIALVERTRNSTLSSNADPETFFIDGRPDESAALVNGRLSWADGDLDVEILLSKPLTSWRICTVTLR